MNIINLTPIMLFHLFHLTCCLQVKFYSFFLSNSCAHLTHSFLIIFSGFNKWFQKLAQSAFDILITGTALPQIQTPEVTLFKLFKSVGINSLLWSPGTKTEAVGFSYHSLKNIYIFFGFRL